MTRSPAAAASVLPRWCGAALARLALAAGLWGSAAAALAAEGPVLLSDRQLDAVTAGTATVNLDLSASAQGQAATAATTGAIRAADTTILLIELRKTASGVTVPRLLGPSPAGIVLAAGDATASGSEAAQCSAGVEPSGDFAFLIQAAAKTVNPGPPIAVNCACAAFGITLGAH